MNIYEPWLTTDPWRHERCPIRLEDAVLVSYSDWNATGLQVPRTDREIMASSWSINKINQEWLRILVENDGW